nr:hypothetical protein [Tanacetum cinerariifolium]
MPTRKAPRTRTTLAIASATTLITDAAIRPVRPTRECTYSDFLKCQPLNFKGTEGVVGLTQWFERIESIFHIGNYAIENQVKFATCTLHGIALTWWNTHELALLCWRMFPEESDKVENYVGGLPDMIHGSVMVSRPKTIQDAIEFATEWMDKEIRTLAERQAENKKKFDNNNQAPNNFPRGRIWLKLTPMGLVKRMSMVELFYCATSASFTTMAHALQSA